MKKAKAGDGIPCYEKSFVKYILIPYSNIFINWDKSVGLLKKEVKTIKSLIKSIQKKMFKKELK